LAKFFPERLLITALAGHKDAEALAFQAALFRPGLVAVAGDEERRALSGHLKIMEPGQRPQIEIGEKGLDMVAAESGAEAVLSAISGAAGLKPTYAAAKKGLKIALANKESLVMAGDILMPLIGDKLSPVDSEHSAIFQALGGRLRGEGLRRIVLTASGGPFRGWDLKRLKAVTREKALKHPTWSMGPKITIDSATLMNKGLEVIEAHHLFGLSYDQIDVAVQPSSVVHSIAEFSDGSQLAQMGPADMRLAIAYALSHPDRWPLLEAGDPLRDPLLDSFFEKEEFLLRKAKIGDFSNYLPFELKEPVTFEAPDRKAFPCLALAEAAGRAGGTAPSILNGANEAAVEAFLADKLPFLKIAEVVAWCLDLLPAGPLNDLEGALAADAEARALAKAKIESLRKG
jgi:1-deoxy-D-xylulose-5-phosphate reductoisomerase